MYELIDENLDMLEVDGFYHEVPAKLNGPPENCHPDESEIEFRFMEPMFLSWDEWDPDLHPLEEANGFYTIAHGGVSFTMDLSFTVVKITQHGFFLSIEIDYDSLDAEVEEEEPDYYDGDPEADFYERVSRDADEYWSRF